MYKCLYNLQVMLIELLRFLVYIHKDICSHLLYQYMAINYKNADIKYLNGYREY